MHTQNNVGCINVYLPEQFFYNVTTMLLEYMLFLLWWICCFDFFYPLMHKSMQAQHIMSKTREIFDREVILLSWCCIWSDSSNTWLKSRKNLTGTLPSHDQATRMLGDAGILCSIISEQQHDGVIVLHSDANELMIISMLAYMLRTFVISFAGIELGFNIFQMTCLGKEEQVLQVTAACVKKMIIVLKMMKMILSNVKLMPTQTLYVAQPLWPW